jgi:hypothetical protein
LHCLLRRASAVRSHAGSVLYAVKWCVVKINDFLMIFGSSHGDRSAAAFRVIRSTKPKTRALCRASRCEHASNARRIALTWVRTVLAYGSWFSHVPPPAPGPIIRLTIPAHRDNLRGQDDTLRQYASFVKFTVRTYKLLYTGSSGVGHDPGSLAAAQKFYWGFVSGIYWRSCRLPRCWIMSSTISFSRSERLRLLLRMARALRSPSALISCSPSNAGLLPVSRK